jgi:3' terminal RNA ribose 2'-O-methyltransferase Hen1
VLLTISTTHAPATDLGFLLHKHPGRVNARHVASGTAYVFFPEATEERCTAALLLEVDPVALVRGSAHRGGSAGHGNAGHDSSAHYVNDRPYAASSLLAVALKEAYGTALTGRCDTRPELAASAIPLEVRVPALRCAGGPDLATRLFEPLGWTITADPVPLDPAEWGMSRYVDLRLAGPQRLADALNHLYVLLPVLDDAKHYWVAPDEVDKLIRAGDGWLASHPEKALITRRYLAHQRGLTASALARLAEADDLAPEDVDNAVPEESEASAASAEDNTVPGENNQAPLAVQRQEAVLAALRESGARSVGDLGCGDGALLRHLVAEQGIDRVVAADVSARALQIAARRLRLDRMPDAKRNRVTLVQSGLTYRDERLAGLDAAVLMEVIEHVDDERLPALERTVFGFAAPATVLVTTPNCEHNAVYGMAPGALRHPDHRWEWTRAQFRAWADAAAGTYGYDVRIRGIGPDDPQGGQPTQMAVFTRRKATP